MGSHNVSEDFYFGSSMPYCRAGNVSAYIYNITSPYTDDTNKASIIGTSVAMFTLTVLFFNLTMFRHIGPTIRLARSTALSLFLPVMSYLFSEAKNAAGATVSTAVVTEIVHSELAMRARLILTWMLLVELLRKKTEAMSVPMAGYSGNAEQAARIAWLGSLVFSTIQSPGRRAVFGVLWVVAAAKMVQRFVIAQVIRCSFATGRNPEIIGAYTLHSLERSASAENTQGELIRCCEFAVMGEEKVKMKTGPHGYVAATHQHNNVDDGVITVAKIWRDGDELPVEAKKLCLSFSMYKLLRRRLEDARARTSGDDMKITEACRRLIVNEGHDPEELLRVVGDEANFLREYYHSVDPVVLASPFFLLANYILFPVAVGCVCLMTVVACGSGDVLGTFRSIRTDNYAMSPDVVKMVVCLMRKVLVSPPALLSAIDLCITFFLIVAYVYEEVSEFVVFLLSDWLLVSLVCSYVKATRHGCRQVIVSSTRCILRLRRMFTERELILKLKQLDLADTAFRVPMVLQRSPLPIATKVAVIEYLANCISNGGAVTLGNCNAIIRQYARQLSAYEDDSIAQVILIWHVATTLLEARHPQRNGAAVDDRSTVMTLSRYCAYLVAFRPEILPNDWNDTRQVYQTMVRDLKKRLGCRGYYFYPKRSWLEEIEKSVSGDIGKEGVSVVQKGAMLGEAIQSSGSSSEELWKMLADVWVELVVYIAPTSEDTHLQGHYAALVEGGEFITLLWALATHSTLTRQPLASTTGVGAVDSDF